MKGLDILEYEGSGYKRLVNNGKWTFAGLNWAPRFDENNLADLERHNLTDEVFILVQGKAALLIGENCERVEMEPLKYYNVRAGIWHNIVVSKDARVPTPPRTIRSIFPFLRERFSGSFLSLRRSCPALSS